MMQHATAARFSKRSRVINRKEGLSNRRCTEAAGLTWDSFLTTWMLPSMASRVRIP